MRCAIIINDVVDNVIEVESLAAAEAIFPDAQCLDADAEGIGMGHTRSGGVWSAPVTTSTLPPLTRRQLRLGLLSIGITAEDVEAQINAIVDPTERAYGMIEWQDATQFRRDHPLIAQVAVALALPPEQVDDLWVWALGL